MSPEDRRAARERDVEAEFRFHHDQTIDELRQRGLSTEEAEREAARRFGDRACWQSRIVAEDTRPPRARPLIGRLRHALVAAARDGRQAVRSLARARLFTLATAGVFGLGLAAVTVAFALVYGVLVAPLPYPAPDRLVYVWGRNANVRTGYPNLPVSEPDLLDWRTHATHLAAIGGAIPETRTLTGAGEPERVAAVAVIGDLFDALGVQPLFGRALRASDPADGRPPVVLGHTLWLRRFNGDPAVVGRSVLLDDRPHEIVGVMPPHFAFPRVEEISATYGFAPDVSLYLPWRTGAAGPAVRGNRYIVAAARLREDATPTDVERELAAISDHAAGRAPYSGDRFAVVGFAAQATGAVRGTVWLVTSAAFVVLAIACLNVSHLLLVRVHGRRHEFAVRTSLGAGRLAVVRQLVAESLLLAGLGGVGGVALATLLLSVLVRVAPADLPRLEAIAVNGWVIVGLLAVIAAVGIAVGLIAALTLRWRQLQVSLRETGRASSGGGRWSRLLIGAEVALSVLLLLAAGLLVRSLVRVLTTDPGFAAGNLLTFQVSLPAARYPTGEHVQRGYEALVDAVNAVPGVVRAAVTWQLPMSGTQGSTSYLRDDGQSGMALIHRVSPHYFDVMHMRIVRGRALDGDHDLPPLVINEQLARTQWRDRDPIGDIVTVNAVRSRIVGVVNDVRHGSLEQHPAAEMYRVARLRSMFVVARTDVPPHALVPAVRAAVARVDPAVPLSDVTSMDERLSGTTSRRRFVVAGIGVFAAVASLLALIGLYGVTVMLVTRRRREVGIRMALGATPSGAVTLLMRQIGVVIGAGLGAGVAASVTLAPQMRPFLHETSPTDPVTHAVVIGGLALCAGLAVYVPARRTARVDLAAILRAS